MTEKIKIRSGDIVNYVWNFKSEFEKRTGKSVYFSFTLGNLRGHICTVITLGVEGRFIHVKVKDGWGNNRGVARAKVFFNKTFAPVTEVAV